MASENRQDNIAVGYDARKSSPQYCEALLRGMADEGINCFSIGMVPTPVLYHTVYTHNLGGGIQVTGSHNPPDMNGFKICLGTHTLSGAEIQDLKERMIKLQNQDPQQKQRGQISKKEVLDTYVKDLTQNIKDHLGKRKIKVVVDAGNGVGGITGPKIMRALGFEVHELFCEPDGMFPNHHPDPTVLENLHDLIAKVRETKADLGIGWDGDADRIGAVDENGQVIHGDMLLLIFARSILKEIPNATIIGDVKCSDLLFSDLKSRGANAIMGRTGHSLIKNKLKETGGALGGEMSAHIFFKHRFYGFDDAVYASLRLCEILTNTEQPLSKLLSDLPKRVSTPEIRVDCPEQVKFKIVDRAKQLFSEFETNTIDGVRVTFDKGWGLVRASNTQPVLVMRFEADNQENLNRYQKLVVDRIESVKRELGA